jgi:nucleoside-diphosphate-sugar epimerase
MTGRRVLVTGATGLIGRALTARLVAAGYAVIGVVRPGSLVASAPNLSTIEVDLAKASEQDWASAGRFDAVVHLAQAPGWHDFPAVASSAAAVNVAATIALAQAAVVSGATHFVYASSGGIYGPSPLPIDEAAPLKPAADLGYYLATKIAAEQLLSYFAPHLALHVLRPFFVYGPGQKDAFLLPRLVKSVRTGIPIRVASGRGPLLNPIWVGDAADAFVRALETGGSTTVNLAGPQTVSLRDIARTLGHLLGREPVFDETSEEPTDYVADVSRLSATFGPAQTDMAEGLPTLFGASESGAESRPGACW